MKTTKRLFVLMLVAVLAVVCFVPATFSWYPHNDSASGTKLLVENDLPVSVKTGANKVTAVTHTADANGVATDTTVNAINLAPNSGKAVQYYKTTLENKGTDDVMVDLETSDMANNADFYIGTTSPTVNEKAYASRPVRNKVSDTTVRVYFKTNNNFSPYWTNYVGDNTTVNYNDQQNITNDFNIAYRISGANSDTYAKLNRCSGTAWSSSNPASTVFYYDVPSNVDYFFFFNHWYIKSTSNREWNSTINITDLTAGKLYYLTGNKVDDKWKEYAVQTNNGSDIDKDLVAVNSYYSSVRLSTGAGVYADIGLKKTSDAEDFVPEYYGQTITYRSSNTNICTVNTDGLITPQGTGTANITTTITGKYGDTRTITTTVNIPASIDQVPIIKNVRVPAGEKVTVDWYALNKSPSATMETTSIFFTL